MRHIRIFEFFFLFYFTPLQNIFFCFNYSSLILHTLQNPTEPPLHHHPHQTMDVRLECKASGRDCSLIVDEHDTATTLMRGALDAWGYTSREYVLLLEGNALDGNDYVRDHAIVSGTTLVVESCDEEYVRAHLEGRLLQDCPKWMLADERIVIGAVRRQGPLLQYASEALKDSFAVVMAAVEHTGAALRFASTRLCGDAVVCKTAVSQNGFALKYVTENMTRDRSVVLAAVEQEGTSLALAHSSLKGDRDVVATAVHNAPEAWRYATEELRAETGNVCPPLYVAP